MALPQSYAAVGEIPTAFREHYTEKDGRFLLQTDPPTEDVTGLKTALDSERRLRREAESQFTAFKTKFEGIDPADVATMRERLDSLKDKEVHDKDGLEALKARHTAQMKADHERELAALKRANEVLQAQYGEIDQKWRRDRIETQLTGALVKAGIAPYAMPDAVSRGLQIFVDINEAGAAIAKKGEEVIYGKNGVDPFSPEEWILGVRTSGQAPHLWPPSSGGGAQHGYGNGAGGTDYSKLPPAERLTKYREAQAGRT